MGIWRRIIACFTVAAAPSDAGGGKVSCIRRNCPHLPQARAAPYATAALRVGLPGKRHSLRTVYNNSPFPANNVRAALVFRRMLGWRCGTVNHDAGRQRTVWTEANTVGINSLAYHQLLIMLN
jgi:hypothetical protein